MTTDIVVELADGREERYGGDTHHVSVPDSGALVIYRRGETDARGRRAESTLEVAYAPHAWVQLTAVDE